MAETILFSLPAPGPYEDPAWDMVWYQSVDGIIWDAAPVDTILVSALAISPLGQYIWNSFLADANRYHKVKSRTQLGVESTSALLLPPRVLATMPLITGMSMNTDATYSLGDKVELMLQVDEDKLPLLGDQVSVDIVDTHNNTIASLVADKLGNIFIAEWTVPFGLGQSYNPTMLPEPEDTSYFYLRDRWVLGASVMQFNFKVSRVVESATEENSVIQILVDGLKSATNTTIQKTALVFSTAMAPFYSTVREVRDIYRELLDGVDNFTLARMVWNISMVVDHHMKPSQIDPRKQAAFDLAVRNYVKFQSALSLLTPMMQTSSETKELDTFKVSRSAGNPRLILDHIEKEARRFALIIWAGGLDTPFISKRFEKGLWDPSRLVIGRAKLDTSDRFPWVNKTSGNTLMRIDGDDVEVRGERTISLNSNPRFDYSNLIGLENPEGLWLI